MFQGVTILSVKNLNLNLDLDLKKADQILSFQIFID